MKGARGPVREDVDEELEGEDEGEDEVQVVEQLRAGRCHGEDSGPVRGI